MNDVNIFMFLGSQRYLRGESSRARLLNPRSGRGDSHENLFGPFCYLTTPKNAGVILLAFHIFDKITPEFFRVFTCNKTYALLWIYT